MKSLKVRKEEVYKRVAAVLEIIRMSHHKKKPSVRNAIKLLVSSGISVKTWGDVLEQLKHINNNERICSDPELSKIYGKRDNKFLGDVLVALEKYYSKKKVRI